jgi:nitronate monooxygenase
MTPRASALCESLGIRYPIVQSGMSRVAGPELVAAVGNAGGLGILAALRLEPAALRTQIREIRRLTTAPFGVNLWLHPSVVDPIAPDTIDPAARAAAAERLNAIRSHLGLDPADVNPSPFPDLVAANFDVILQERVAVWSIGLGSPHPDMVARCHEHGVQVMAMVTNVDDALTVVAAGVDIVVAQGTEAGGHRSNWHQTSGEAGTMVIVPQIVDAVDRPVLAAGGIVDGRGLVAALALGASGVMLGTRFIATKESIAPPFFKNAVISAGPGDTVISSAFTGLPMRTLRNRFSTEYGDGATLPPLLQSNAAEPIFRRAAERADASYYPMPAGESAGLVSDMPSAGSVVTAMVREAQQAIRTLGSSSSHA